MINFNSSPKFVLSYDKLMSNSSPNSDDTDRFLLLVEEGRTTDIRLGALYCAVVFSVLITAPLPRIDIYMYTKFYLYSNITIANETIQKVQFWWEEIDFLIANRESQIILDLMKNTEIYKYLVLLKFNIDSRSWEEISDNICFFARSNWLPT